MRLVMMLQSVLGQIEKRLGFVWGRVEFPVALANHETIVPASSEAVG